MMYNCKQIQSKSVQRPLEQQQLQRRPRQQRKQQRQQLEKQGILILPLIEGEEHTQTAKLSVSLTLTLGYLLNIVNKEANGKNNKHITNIF